MMTLGVLQCLMTFPPPHTFHTLCKQVYCYIYTITVKPIYKTMIDELANGSL